MMPCERKSVEPMAAVTAPERTAAQHQSLLHFVGEGRWSDEKVLAKVREMVLPEIVRHGQIEAWIIDDTGFPKQGRHSVGVARQYCGQLGKQDNCQVAVSLSIANRHASLPVAYRLALRLFVRWVRHGPADPSQLLTRADPARGGRRMRPVLHLDPVRRPAARSGLSQFPLNECGGTGPDPARGRRLEKKLIGLIRVAMGFTKKWAADNLTGWIDFTEPHFAAQTMGWRWVFVIALAFRIPGKTPFTTQRAGDCRPGGQPVWSRPRYRTHEGGHGESLARRSRRV